MGGSELLHSTIVDFVKQLGKSSEKKKLKRYRKWQMTRWTSEPFKTAQGCSPRRRRTCFLVNKPGKTSWPEPEGIHHKMQPPRWALKTERPGRSLLKTQNNKMVEFWNKVLQWKKKILPFISNRMESKKRGDNKKESSFYLSNTVVLMLRLGHACLLMKLARQHLLMVSLLTEATAWMQTYTGTFCVLRFRQLSRN